MEKRTRELSESEGKYRVLVEEINDGYFVNQRGLIVFANQTFCDLHGVPPPREMFGRPFVISSRPMDWPGTLKPFDFFNKAIEKKLHKL